MKYQSYLVAVWTEGEPVRWVAQATTLEEAQEEFDDWDGCEHYVAIIPLLAFSAPKD